MGRFLTAIAKIIKSIEAEKNCDTYFLSSLTLRVPESYSSKTTNNTDLFLQKWLALSDNFYPKFIMYLIVSNR
jgi:hypothetical protein